MASLRTIPKDGTFAALNNSNFRLYFIGQLISMSGTWMQNIAQGYLVFSLTQSEFWLGIVAFAAGAPMLIVSPFAGVIVERFSRRNLLIITQVIQMTLAFILCALVVTDSVQIWQIVALATILGITNAFDAPARQTFISDLVNRENLTSGIALNSIIVNGSRVLGPSVAGAVLLLFGVAWCFFLNGLSFLAVIGSLVVLQLPSTRRETLGRPLQQLLEGVRYARDNDLVRPILLLAANGGFFGWAILSQLPSFAEVVLNSRDTAYALISAANGVGAVIAGLTVSLYAERFGRGRYLCYVAAGGCITLVLFSQTVTIPIAMLMSTLYGFFIVSYLVTCNTTLQLAISNELRGRVMSLYTLAILGLLPIGSLLLGALAEWLGNPTALALFGLAMGISSALILTYAPALRARR